MTSNPTRVSHPSMVLHHGSVALVCDAAGEVRAEELQGLFAGDTRVLSSYRFGIGGNAWRVLACRRFDNGSARWEFQNRLFRAATGEIPPGSVLLRLDRHLDNVLHDDFVLSSFLERPLHVRFAFLLDADFADIFEVKGRSLHPRVSISRATGPHGTTLEYAREGFRRGLALSFTSDGPRPRFAGAQTVFNLDLPPKGEWTCRMEAVPVIDGKPLESRQDIRPTNGGIAIPQDSLRPVLESEPLLALPFRRGQDDLRALAMSQDGGPPYIAAGAPWFLTLFGRDPLVTALMAGIDGSWTAEGILAALGPLQARVRDDWRDAEPGKLLHELRRGEMAWQGEIPHTPYYGAHDPPALYCLALWNAWRWTGDRALLTRHLETAKAALRWCDGLGDRDGDGLLEYGTRSRRGYRNQGWKDAGDAIVHADGRLAAPPLATVELQGYLFAARLAMAELMDATGDPAEASRLRAAARTLRTLVEERFWVEALCFYALALDKDKRQVAGIASNPGHLLWCGLPSPEHARAVADCLLGEDMFTGYGLRTLSALNPAYNPLSYQRGSVWPHDTLLAAAGLWRYGLRDQAGRLVQAVLEAARAFEDERLPELFCGLDRLHGMPVPYEEANVPQAWAAAAPLLAAQLFLGLVPDAPRRRCFLDPWLPEWLPRLEMRNIAIGAGRLGVTVVRHGGRTVVESAEAEGVEVIQATPEAPLWGAPVLRI